MNNDLSLKVNMLYKILSISLTFPIPFLKMFPSSRFRNIPCPMMPNCPRMHYCYFSHAAQRPSAVLKKILTDSSTQTLAIIPKARSHSLKNPSQPEFYANKRTKIEESGSLVSSIDSVKASTITNQKPANLTSNLQLNSSNSPRVQPNLQSKIPRESRQKAVDAFHRQFSRIYATLPASLAVSHALKQEVAVLVKSTERTYDSLRMGVYRRLMQRVPAKDLNDVGIDGEYACTVSATSSSLDSRLLKRYVIDSEMMVKLRYPTVSALAALMLKIAITDQTKIIDLNQDCIRCGTKFIPDASQSHDCTHHHGRIRSRNVDGSKEFYNTCCNQIKTSNGCVNGPHVFKEESMDLLHSRIPFITIPDSSNSLKVIAIDCEMVFFCFLSSLILQPGLKSQG